jgi:hypothetical protein
LDCASTLTSLRHGQPPLMLHSVIGSHVLRVVLYEPRVGRPVAQCMKRSGGWWNQKLRNHVNCKRPASSSQFLKIRLKDRSLSLGLYACNNCSIFNMDFHSDPPEIQPTDSGYATSSNTPVKQETARESIRGSDIGRRIESLTKTNGLRSFDKPLDAATLHRFKDVHDRLYEPLVRYMQKKAPKRYRPTSIRLMILGKEEGDAGPSLVVFCNEQAAKYARRWLKKTYAKDLCEPGNGDLPSFKTYVFGQPPQPHFTTQEIEVFEGIDDLDLPTKIEGVCGRPLRIIKGQQTRLATLGGVIEIVTPLDHNSALYGLTCGHASLEVEPESIFSPANSNYNPDDSEATSSSDEEDEEELEEGIFEDSSKLNQQQRSSARLLSPIDDSQGPPSFTLSSTLQKTNSPDNWRRLGSISPKESPSSHEESKYYDWALVRFTDKLVPKKGAYESIRLHNQNRLNALKPCFPSDAIWPTSKQVLMISGLRKLPAKGKLSNWPSSILLGPGTSPVESYTLTLDGGLSKYFLFTQYFLND